MNRLTKLSLYVLGCILAAVCALSISSCEAPTTKAETEQIEVLDARIDETKAQLDELEGEAKEQAALLVDADPANNADATAQLEEIHGRYVQLGQALTADLAARGAILDEAAGRVTQPVAGGLATMFPAWSPLILAGGALASRLITKRSRDHLLDSFKALGKAQVGDFVGGLLKSLGYTHSNTEPTKVLDGAAAAAAKQEDADAHNRILALKAELEARPLTPHTT